MKIYLFLLPVLFITELMGRKVDIFPGTNRYGCNGRENPYIMEWGSILWKKSLPGEGQSSVVEAGNKIFVTASEKFR